MRLPSSELKFEVSLFTVDCLPSQIQMDMDMDIPLPEELELLESNARLLEDYPDLEPPEPYPYKDQEAPPAAQPPSSPDLEFDSEIQVIGQKRSRSVSPNGSLSEAAGLSEEKRCRTDESARATDEDWLRYSPPKGSESVVAEQASFVREKMLSRYASEINGECIPITAPNGDRVYARIDRLEGEERLKKLDVRANSGGRISYTIIPITHYIHYLSLPIFSAPVHHISF